MAKFNSKIALKRCLIVYAAIFLIGIIMTVIFGVKFDINFVGGTRISYSYTGDIELNDFEKVIKDTIDNDFTASKSTALAGDTKTVSINLTGRNTLSADSQEAITKALEKEFKDNKIELYDSNSVSPTIAGNFFAKSLMAILITAILVVIYVGFRFRNIGGVSAGITAFIALVFDLLVSFFACVIFRLQIDSNYMAVVLTILGYSLNDTIVIYDRVRENKKLYPHIPLEENMNMSIGSIITRNIVTTTTTILAVLTIIVVAEIFGLTSLRTFAIPMAFGLLSGCVSSLFISGPVWVIWREKVAAKPRKRKN